MAMTFDHIFVDGNYLARRFFETHKELKAEIDENLVWTGLTHGFLLHLCMLKKSYGGRVVVAWDAGNNRRRAIDESYKQNRKKEWDEREWYNDHLKILKYFLRLLSVKQAFKPGEEGDDVLYTLAKRNTGRRLIVSNDHDLYQALGPDVFQLLAKKERYVVMSERLLKREQGVSSEGWNYAMSLAGCSGDGVSGIRGVGMKTALEFVKRWPDFVPSLLEGRPTDEWLPECNKQNRVKVATSKFPEAGKKGPVLKLRRCIEESQSVQKTNMLISLYDVAPLVFKAPAVFDGPLLEKQLERAELHSCLEQIDVLTELRR
jgi:5'-3' exonuclease